MQAKDYSKDPFVNDWYVPSQFEGPTAGMPNAPMSGIAMQAQGY